MSEVKLEDLEYLLRQKVLIKNWCWEYQGSLNHNGYGIIKRNRITYRAHRYVYSNNVGEIPKGLLVLHKCDNPACINPNHLFLGTHKDNHDDMVKKGRHRYKKLREESEVENDSGVK